MEHKATTIQVLGRQIAHASKITGTFLILFGVSIGLDQLIQFLLAKHILHEKTALCYAIYVAKYMTITADVVSFGALVYKLTVHSIKE